VSRTPDYQPQFIECLLQQIIAILQRDLMDNLALANPAASFQPIGGYHTSPQDLYEQPPEIVVEALSTAIVRDEQIALTAEHTIAVSAVIAADGDSEDLARASRDYARALVMTLGRAQDLSDYTTPLPIVMPDGSATNTPGFPRGAVLEASVVSVNWALRGTTQAQFARQPIVELAITGVEQ